MNRYIPVPEHRDYWRFTPLEIKMLLHYYAIAAPFKSPYWPSIKNDPDPPAVVEQRQRLIDDGYIKSDESWPAFYRTTEKGNAIVALICNPPDPIEVWCYSVGDES